MNSNEEDYADAAAGCVVAFIVTAATWIAAAAILIIVFVELN